MLGLFAGAMCHQMIERLSILVCLIGLSVPVDAWGFAHPEDEAVTAYLEEHGLGAMLEVQLFDRLQHEDDSLERIRLAERLGGLYLESLGRADLSEIERERVLAKGGVLVGMVPGDVLLDLRLTLLIEQYKRHEQAADLYRIGLLDEQSRSLAIESLRSVSMDFARIGVLAHGQVEVFDRGASRSSDVLQAEFEEKLTGALNIRSRARFFHGWAGYSLAALTGRAVVADVFQSFGWVLGFEGKMPVLDRVDQDLFEYDHVSRSVIGVALCKLHNGDLSEARVWLSAIEESLNAPESAVEIAKQRQLEVLLAERDWIASKRRAEMLGRASPDSLLGVAQARLLVIEPLSAMGSRDQGRGGVEGIQEVTRIGLDRLVELGEIGHVLELRERFGSLPMLSSGFVSLYVQGLAEMAGAERRGDGSGYAQAAVKLSQALGSSDVDRYGEHPGDAVLKLAYCELRLGRAGEASGMLNQYTDLLVTDSQREESAWMQILAHDAAVAAGQDQLGEQLGVLIREYIRLYPSTPRANTLIVRYAMTPYLGAEDAIGALVIEDASDPLAVAARRKLIQLLYKNPELVIGGGGGIGGDDRLFEVISDHARWLWKSEPTEIVDLRDARERLAVCRIVVGAGLGVDAVDTGFLGGVIDRGEAIIETYDALDEASSELGYRRVQVLLLEGEIDRAGAIAMSAGVLDESIRATALLLVYEQAERRFGNRASVPGAQALIRYGRGVIGGVEENSGLDHRMSVVAEGVAGAAEYLADAVGDETMREYAGALSLRVFHEGVPSGEGLVRTAVLGERYGHGDIALECWLRLVGQVDESKVLWQRARYESLRLMVGAEPERAREVYEQFKALHPDGIAEPWGARIEQLMGSVGIGEGGEP